MMLFPLFVALLIIIILTSLLPKAKRNGKNILPPGPLGLPFIGNLHQFDGLTPHLYFWKLSKKYGKIFSLKLGSSTMIVVSSANLAEEVTKTQDLAFCSRPSLLGQQKLSYKVKILACRLTMTIGENFEKYVLFIYLVSRKCNILVQFVKMKYQE
uniref:Cytochrome P450 n=1 Tax=Solanum tuberosum TaxID=4113 RepID=M1D456_SOLTU